MQEDKISTPFWAVNANGRVSRGRSYYRDGSIPRQHAYSSIRYFPTEAQAIECGIRRIAHRVVLLQNIMQGHVRRLDELNNGAPENVLEDRRAFFLP